MASLISNSDYLIHIRLLLIQNEHKYIILQYILTIIRLLSGIETVNLMCYVLNIITYIIIVFQLINYHFNLINNSGCSAGLCK